MCHVNFISGKKKTHVINSKKKKGFFGIQRLNPGLPQIPKSKDAQVPYNAFFPNIFDCGWLNLLTEFIDIDGQLQSFYTHTL